MVFLIFLLSTYILLPIVCINIYFLELASFYPEELALEISMQSIAGIILFFLFMTQIIYGTRVKWLERSVGLNKMLRIHSSTTIFTLIFMLVHRQIHIEAKSFSSLTGYIVMYITIFVIFVTVCFWVPTPFARLPIIKPIRAWLHTKFRYHQFKAIHNLMVIGAVIAAIHIYSSEMASDSVIAINIMWAYFAASMYSYIYHKCIKPIILRKHPWTITNIIHETAQGVTPAILTLELQQQGDKPFVYHAGQFGFLRFISGKMNKEEHPFSFSSSSHSDTLHITIQDEGPYTHSLFTECKLQDTLVIDGPYGKFHLPFSSKHSNASHAMSSSKKKHSHDTNNEAKKIPQSIVAIAGGIGITPFIGWLQEYQNNTDIDIPLNVLWLRREQEDELARKVLSYNGERNASVQMFSREKQSVLDLQTLTSYSQEDAVYFVCASRKIVNNIITMLTKLGVKRSKIHTELFNF